MTEQAGMDVLDFVAISTGLWLEIAEGRDDPVYLVGSVVGDDEDDSCRHCVVTLKLSNLSQAVTPARARSHWA